MCHLARATSKKKNTPPPLQPPPQLQPTTTRDVNQCSQQRKGKGVRSSKGPPVKSAKGGGRSVQPVRRKQKKKGKKKIGKW